MGTNQQSMVADSSFRLSIPYVDNHYGYADGIVDPKEYASNFTSVVAHHLGDAQPVVREYSAPARGLRRAMPQMVAPDPDCGVVAPELQREELAFLVQALEPFDRVNPSIRSTSARSEAASVR